MARKHHNLVAWQEAILEKFIDSVLALVNGLINAERRKGATK